MRKTLAWMLYVTAYTGLFGIPLLFFPDAVLPLLGFAPTTGPWVRLSGMFLLVLSYFTFIIYHKNIVALLPHTIIARTGISIVLIALGIAGQPPFLFVIALIVLVGVIGSLLSYIRENRAPR